MARLSGVVLLTIRLSLSHNGVLPREGVAKMAETNGSNKLSSNKPFAFQGKKGNAFAVFLAHIKVLVLNDDGSWFAQGLDIDYAAQGTSLEDVKKRFEDGLEKTLIEHLKSRGNISGVLQVAPKQYWEKYYQQPSHWVYTYGGVHIMEPQSVDLQFQYVQPQEAVLAA